LPGTACLATRDGLDRLIAALRAEGRTVIGPTVRDQVIVYAEIGGTADLPKGWGDEHEAGRYRLRRRGDAALFGYVVGPQSWKQFLFPAESRVWSASRTAEGIRFEPEPLPETRWAFIGVRSCELAAIVRQDRVFTGGEFVDQRYAQRRAGVFTVAVNCAEPGGTCFCTSMETGPVVRSGHDIALTELLDDAGHRFLLEAGSEAGGALLDGLGLPAAAAADIEAARRQGETAAGRMGRRLATAGLREALLDNLEHEAWDEVATRCLACANCTLACPTCFCHTAEDQTDLTGDHSERWLRWDSCFTHDFTQVHGGAVRASGRSRYRQWLTHKLATWWDQFGTSGCVGCGRCVTWCPVGIDITVEAGRFQALGTSSGEPS
jgi:ferredoxin